MDLVEFLQARLDEDEEVAQRENTWPSGKTKSDADWDHVAGQADSALVGMFSPARVLAEVEAKRRIVERVFQYEETLDGEWACCHSDDEIRAGYCAETPVNKIEILRLLALPYADHPDYRQEWKS